MKTATIRAIPVGAIVSFMGPKKTIKRGVLVKRSNVGKKARVAVHGGKTWILNDADFLQVHHVPPAHLLKPLKRVPSGKVTESNMATQNRAAA